MAINLVTKFSPLVDERFEVESKTSLVTNKDYDFVGAKTLKIYSVATAPMYNYGRNADIGNDGSQDQVLSRYGLIEDLATETQEVSMEKDRSFIFVIDKMDQDETLQALNAGSALARQLREVVIPEVDTYTYKKMADNAGKTLYGQTITSSTAYTALTEGTEYMDEKKVPADGRVVVCTPKFYKLLKQDKNAVLETEIGENMRIKGVIANMDGMVIQKVVSSLLPTNINFMIAHKIATTQAIKLAEYETIDGGALASGKIVKGRIYYTAFVRNNKKNAIYVNTGASQPASL